MKVGDVVKIKENLKVDKVYGGVTFVSDMKKYRGKQAKITNLSEYYYNHGRFCKNLNGYYSLDIDNGEYVWSDNILEPIKKYEVIVEGNTVTVKDDKGNEGIAKCSPEDEFNLPIGISLAISRLKWKPSFGAIYYTIYFTDESSVDWYNWHGDATDNALYEKGLVFKTKEEAKEIAKIMLDSIKEK